MSNVRSKFSVVDRVILDTGSEARTQQHFKDECDINKILAKYRKTGVIQHVNRARELYGDFSDFTGLADKMDVVARANQSFDLLPAELRNKFGNDIKSFLRYIDDPRHFEECVEMGIYDPPTVDPTASTTATPPPPVPEAPGSIEPVPEPTPSKKKK